jgi:hypothetical protein
MEPTPLFKPPPEARKESRWTIETTGNASD